ncbi:LysR family transcriptional regulator [Rhodovibrionaceae bacterium A322]
MADPKLTNWNLLHTFVVIVENQSVSRAAEVLRRGQPAVSAALKNLEEQLGCTLVLRSSKSFTLTEAGRALFPEARDICNSVDRISTLVSDSSGDLKGVVKVAIASHMVSPLLDQAFSQFHERHPGASFSISVLRIPEILERVASGFSAFGIAPISVKRPELDYLHLYREYCGFYCGPKHRFFGRKDLALSDLEGEKAVTYPSAVFSDDLQSIAEMRHRVKFADPFVGVSNNTEELKRMIIAGLGIGPIPVHVAQPEVEAGQLWRLPPYGDAMQVDVHLITNPAVTPSRTEAAFIECVTQSAMALPLAARTYPLDPDR